MSRILNRQRQMAEQGRLRLGYTVPTDKGKLRPVRSETWIVTSHSEEQVRAAAELWGGTPERWKPQGNGAEQWRVMTDVTVIPALLPPGDPLTQAYESWSRGGVTLRCDGATEQLSGSPCVCLARFGDTWYEQPKGKVCDTKTRLKVLLEAMPGLGVWRMETGSFYAADEVAGMVDTIRNAVGDGPIVPIQLRIEPRTRVANGETKQFVVPVVELRGVTAGALLGGDVAQFALGTPRAAQAAVAGGERTAIAAGSEPAAPPVDFLAEALAVATIEDWRDVYRRASQSPQWSPEMKAAITQAGERFNTAPAPETDGGASAQGVALAGSAADAPPPSTPPAEEVVEAEPVDDDGNRAWQELLAVAGEQKISSADLDQGFEEWSSGKLTTANAPAADLRAYRDHLRGKAKAA